MQHIAKPSFYFNTMAQTSIIRESTYLGAGQSLSKIIARPSKTSYRLMTPGQGEQLDSRIHLFNKVRALKRDFYLTAGRSPKKLADMYKWAVVEGFELLIQDDEIRLYMPVELLHIQLKSKTQNTPTIVYFHAAKEDLGTCAHFLMDLSSQLHCEIVAFEYPSFKQKDRQEKLSKVCQNQLLEFSKMALNFAKAKTQNNVFLFASGEGAIPCTMLAKDQQERITGVIYEQPLIQYYKRQGLKKVKETKFLEMVRSLDCLNFFVYHGMAGQRIPFDNAKSIIHNAWNQDTSRDRQISTDSIAVHSVARSPSPTRELERVIEHYFVECDNYKIREIKRAKLYDILRNFLMEVNQRQQKSVMLSIPGKTQRRKIHGYSASYDNMLGGNQNILRKSKQYKSRNFKDLSEHYSQKTPRRDCSECDTTGEWRGEREQEKSERSSSQQSLKRKSVMPRYRIGKHFHLKKKLQQRKETQTSTLEGEEEDEEDDSTPLADISLIDPRARYNSMKQGSSLETPFPLSQYLEPSNNDTYQEVN